MHVLTPDRRQAYAGYRAFRWIAWRLPLTWLVAPFLYLPGVPWLGNRVYRWVAKNRFNLVPCDDGGCKVPLKKGPPSVAARSVPFPDPGRIPHSRSTGGTRTADLIGGHGRPAGHGSPGESVGTEAAHDAVGVDEGGGGGAGLRGVRRGAGAAGAGLRRAPAPSSPRRPRTAPGRGT